MGINYSYSVNNKLYLRNDQMQIPLEAADYLDYTT